MKRRSFITLLGGTAAAWPLAARAQQRPLIAFLGTSVKATGWRYYSGFPQGMTELGYVEGRDYTFADRYAEGDPANLKLCQRGAWEDRMLVKTVFSMLTLVSHFKKVMHRVWDYFEARLAFTMAAFNVLVQWHGLRPTASGFVPLSIAEFSL